MAGPQPFDGPAPTPPPLSLLVSAATPSEGDDRWVAGFTYEPRTDITGGVGRIVLCGSKDPETDAKGLETAAPAITWRPYNIYAGHTCDVADWRSRAFEQRARDALNAIEAKLIEHELWTGAMSGAAGLGNIYLADASAPNFVDLSPGGASPGVYALAALQEYAASVGSGGRAFIHASRPVVTLWHEKGALRREGRVVMDLYDNIVVPGVGYDGSSPDGDVDPTGETAWAYVTGPVEVRRNAVRLLPDEGAMYAALDRETNDIEWRAERQAVASWDGVVHAGINVELCDLACGAVGS